MLLPAVLAAWVVTVGCATEQVTRWTPSPRVQWGDISPGDIGTVDQGYRLLLSERTEGLFPASLGVTRFAFVPSDSIDPFGPKLVADPQNEFLQWNYAFDDQMAVSEVFPIAQQNLGGANASPDQILRAVSGSPSVSTPPKKRAGETSRASATRESISVSMRRWPFSRRDICDWERPILEARSFPVRRFSSRRSLIC